jgi:UDP-2,3-diacylglucosamine pyrophosphatase LpxH
MLVIISDLHLTDGTSGQTVQWGAFRAFRDRLSDLAYDASWRRDGTYKPIEELHLVLLGDILDVIRSTRWLVENGEPSQVRPWSDSQGPLFVGKVGSITAAILKNNSESLSTLNRLHSTVTIPEATADGKPAAAEWQPEGKNRRPVKVHTHYLVGNHDWFFHLPGEPYNQLRRTIVEALGLENPSNLTFPHNPLESEVIQKIYSDHRVFARHGDIFDPFNYEGDRNRSSLGDAIVVELVGRFSLTVQEQMGGILPKATLDGIKEIDNLRPTLIIPVWVDSLLERTCPDTHLQREVKDVWDRLVDEVLALDFVRNHHSLFHLFDSVGQLEWGLKFSKGVSHGNLSRLFSWIEAKFGTHESSYYSHAAAEAAFKSRSARCIVYGHTHVYEMVPLDSLVMSNSLFDQVYINSGTWRPYHQLCRVHPEHEEFVKYQAMTYLAFFKDDERGGRPFDVWSGVLGAAPLEWDAELINSK